MKHYASAGIKNAISSAKVIVKVTMSLTLGTNRKLSLVQYAYQILSLYLSWLKGYSKGKCGVYILVEVILTTDR